MGNQLFVLELFNSGAKFRLVRPAIVPDVELQQVDGVNAESLANLLRMIKDMLARKCVFVCVFARSRPFPVFRRYLRGDIEPLSRILFVDLANQLITVSFAISPSRIEEVAA